MLNRYNTSFREGSSEVVDTLKKGLVVAMLLGQAGCAYKQVEYPAAIPQGYYNVYTNSNAAILYKRPSSKFGCWLVPGGWNCIRR
jgi:hypothetical protein